MLFAPFSIKSLITPIFSISLTLLENSGPTDCNAELKSLAPFSIKYFVASKLLFLAAISTT